MDNLSFFDTTDGARIAYRLDGPDHAPVLVLSNSIGTDLHMWDAQIADFSQHFRVLRYDARGHGASSVPPGPYSLARLGEDVVELLDHLDIARAHFLGLSLGGIVGQWLGIHAAARIDRLILSNTAAYLGPADIWDASIAAVLQARDMRETTQTFLRNWFPAPMLDGDDPAVVPFRETLLATNRHGLAGSWAAVQQTDLRRDIAAITRPTLVICGEYDTVTSSALGEAIANTIPGARLQVFPAVHLSNVEFPEPFSKAIIAFLMPPQ
ncbi:alpha/beta fold hydrolase [Pandoraea norimbergensis]|uniref:3-oxoadipate enol-lactonase n=1 Tax=Pandoraea norimbergensis TaxID=93219 RepID=A0ABM5WFS8_9BURK|nr:alpha/beta fold hydrolase [Pandoraea norimbergensis]ALS59102.1 3-oxoadipate enol-lactonase [Pandoraea norimbergensis]